MRPQDQRVWVLELGTTPSRGLGKCTMSSAATWTTLLSTVPGRESQLSEREGALSSWKALICADERAVDSTSGPSGPPGGPEAGFPAAPTPAASLLR